MKFNVSLFLTISCTTLNFIASDHGSQIKLQDTLPAAAAATVEISNPQVKPVPYSELRYSVWTFAGKTNTSYLIECNADGSLGATLEKEPIRAKTLYSRSIGERFGKDLHYERNQERLETVINIGKKYSRDLKNAEKTTTQPKLELDQDIAMQFRPQQEQALLALLSQQKNELEGLRADKKAAEELALNIFNQGVEKMKARAAIASHNYAYLKQQSKDAHNLSYNADKKEPYKTIESFTALLDSIPAQAQAAQEKNTGK